MVLLVEVGGGGVEIVLVLKNWRFLRGGRI